MSAVFVRKPSVLLLFLLSCALIHPLRKRKLDDSHGGRTPVILPAPVTVIQERALANDTPNTDCWKQQGLTMVAAPPCVSSGTQPVEGNAKVALMFLVRDDIPTEPIWAAFITAAAQLKLKRAVPPTRPSPPDFLPPITPDPNELNSTCWQHGGPLRPPLDTRRTAFEGEEAPMIADTARWLQATMATDLTAQQLYTKQDLFSIFVHRSPGAAAAATGSVFADRDIPHRVQGEFAQPSLVKAHRLLLRAALADSRNSLFLLLSEACIPLYHPALLWAQLMAEAHVSRVTGRRQSLARWSDVMATEHLAEQHFVKSGQWTSLTRMHAEVVAGDEHVWSQFEQFCRTQEVCKDEGDTTESSEAEWHVCVADEHYVATVLEVYGLQESRDDIGALTHTSWERDSWHPRTFFPGNATETIVAMRGSAADEMCSSAVSHSVLLSASSLFSANSLTDSSAPVQALTPAMTQQLRSFAGTAADTLTSSVPTSPETSEAKSTPSNQRTVLNRSDTALSIRQTMVANLGASQWLGRFRPMYMHCPLVGRKLAREAVSEVAELATRCDGLGFLWDCLHRGAVDTAA